MTETPTANLAEWLLEQITEDGRVADGADWEWLGPWELEKNHGFGPGDAGYYAMLTPRRTKTECDAKRRIIEHINEQQDSAYGEPGSFLPSEWTELLKLLALPYADRPGYRPEWRPE